MSIYPEHVALTLTFGPRIMAGKCVCAS
ncbi:hypothetical protein PHOSAC3_121014 [Mesotoga infera]|nr:hypothetical protein PHOSAC3_121014 [Mesotoga infera]